MVTQWEDEESFAAWRDGPAARRPLPGETSHAPCRPAPTCSEFEVVLDQRPT